ncbi:MAG: DNA starvation/stationary phase protection protein, partial [Clostridia bacterium]|nr:DNA starvation/stationary phase protection protein [Deltaproteobacteria bacterium]
MARSEQQKPLNGEGSFRHLADAQPQVHQRGREIQAYGVLTKTPLFIKDNVRAQSVENLNQLLADTIMLRDMYKRHHWQVSGPTFYQLHLLFDK